MESVYFSRNLENRIRKKNPESTGIDRFDMELGRGDVQHHIYPIFRYIQFKKWFGKEEGKYFSFLADSHTSQHTTQALSDAG